MDPSIEQRRLSVHARRQHGVFTLRQALESGYTRSAVRRHRERGSWEEVRPRVFRALPAGKLAWRSALIALVLSTGGIASRRSAGAMFGLLPEGALDVTVVRNVRCTSRHDVHSTDVLPEIDTTIVDGIPCTSPVRTLLDLGSVIARPRFEDVLDNAVVRGLVDPAHLASRATELAAPARGGCAVVLALLADRTPGCGAVRSVWEARVLRELRRRGLLEPMCNYRLQVGGRTRYLDFAWPDRKVAVEFDGFDFHAVRRRVFDDDKDRHNDLVDEEWRVYRLTSTMLTRDMTRALAPIVRALARTR